MTRVFLSYAQEDGAVADRLVDWLREKHIDLFWWQDAAVAGRRFVGEIERGIAESDLFLVLLSPRYLTSAWCRHERNLAFQREIDLRRQFIFVLKVTDTSYTELGFLRQYDQLDAREPLHVAKLDGLAAALPFYREPSYLQLNSPVQSFRDRMDERAQLVHALTVRGAPGLWVVVSPPQMGKSWFLNRVERDLTAKDSRWSVRLIDLRERPRELRVNAPALLGDLLDVDIAHLPENGPLPDAGLRAIAAAILRRRQPQLFLLDSADLLDPVCAAEVRSALSTVYRRVREAGHEERLGVVIGTRRLDEWRGLGNDPRTGLRFEAIPLTKFGVDVVYGALRELGLDTGADLRWDWAQRLHQLSEGIPALLVRSLNWAVDNGFTAMTASDSDAMFDEVTRAYVHDCLLAPESLRPQGGQLLRQELDVLKRALRVLSTYRLFTQSHLRHHLEADASFQAALTDAGWSRADLWDALGRTSLCDQSVAELWQGIEPSIRRLLYRYYHPNDEDRIAAHVVARNFYLGWTAARTAGREQVVVLVECLWHEALRVVIVQPDLVPSLLPATAAEVAQKFSGYPMYEPREFAEFVDKRLRDDEEIQQLLSRYDGLFEEITKSAVVTMSGFE